MRPAPQRDHQQLRKLRQQLARDKQITRNKPTIRSKLIAKNRKLALGRLLVGSVAVISLMFLLSNWNTRRPAVLSPGSTSREALPPLVMQGGDPHIRALMRTISASEANDPQPYSIIYGGQHVQDLNNHPDQCVLIVSGPYTGDCTTAAGRYQLLTTTWVEKARLYHPQPSRFLFWDSYSFEPEFQDQVVYGWLSDPQAWDADLSELLREGKLDQVLRLLSSTWTSLGYGIEDNSMTSALPEIYQKLLQEELLTAQAS